MRRPSAVASLALGLLAAALVSSGCARRTPEEQAAVRAQDACIAALEPVARDERPSPAALEEAAEAARAAAGVDDRWSALPARVDELRSRPGERGPVDALVEECGRVNRIVKEKRGDEPPSASG